MGQAQHSSRPPTRPLRRALRPPRPGGPHGPGPRPGGGARPEGRVCVCVWRPGHGGSDPLSPAKERRARPPVLPRGKRSHPPAPAAEAEWGWPWPAGQGCSPLLGVQLPLQPPLADESHGAARPRCRRRRRRRHSRPGQARPRRASGRRGERAGPRLQAGG